MLTHLRYALATVCFAASVGCLALWWRSEHHIDLVSVYLTSNTYGQIGTYCGQCGLGLHTNASLAGKYWEHTSEPMYIEYRISVMHRPKFETSSRPVPLAQNRMYYSCHFPLWYSSLIFAFAGVGIIRFRRQFSIRSALIVTTIAATLIGMAVIL